MRVDSIGHTTYLFIINFELSTFDPVHYLSTVVRLFASGNRCIQNLETLLYYGLKITKVILFLSQLIHRKFLIVIGHY